MLQVLYRQASEAPDYGVKFHSKENPKILWFFDPIIKNKELEWNKELPLEWDTILIRTWQRKNNVTDQTKSFKEATVNFVFAFIFY